MKALSESASLDVLFASAQRSASQAAVGFASAPYRNACVVVDVTGYTDGTHDFTIMVSDDGTTWNEAEASVREDLSVSAAADVGTHYLDYLGTAPYVGVKCDTTGTTSGATWGAYLMQTNAHLEPVR